MSWDATCSLEEWESDIVICSICKCSASLSKQDHGRVPEEKLKVIATDCCMSEEYSEKKED